MDFPTQVLNSRRSGVDFPTQVLNSRRSAVTLPVRGLIYCRHEEHAARTADALAYQKAHIAKLSAAVTEVQVRVVIYTAMGGNYLGYTVTSSPPLTFRSLPQASGDPLLFAGAHQQPKGLTSHSCAGGIPSARPYRPIRLIEAETESSAA